MQSAVPILPSRDLGETLAFLQRLGFEETGTPYTVWDYLIVARGGAELHFFRKDDVDPRTSDFSCYLRVESADRVYEEWNAIGVPRDRGTGSRLIAPWDTDYGMREFALVDPSGNLYRIGSS